MLNVQPLNLQAREITDGFNNSPTHKTRTYPRAYNSKTWEQKWKKLLVESRFN